MIWALVIFSWVQGGQAINTNLKFSTREGCEAAAVQIVEASQRGDSRLIRTTCVNSLR